MARLQTTVRPEKTFASLLSFSLGFGIAWSPALADASADWQTKGERCLCANPRLSITYCDRAIQMNPSNAVAYRDRGIAWTLLGNAARATHDLEASIELTPSEEAYYQLALMQEKVDEPEKAIPLYSKALILNPNSIRCLMRRANANRNSAQCAESVSDCNRILKIDPENLDAMCCKSQALLMWNRYPEAVKTLTTLITKLKKCKVRYDYDLATRADAYLRMKNYAADAAAKEVASMRERQAEREQ